MRTPFLVHVLEVRLLGDRAVLEQITIDPFACDRLGLPYTTFAVDPVVEHTKAAAEPAAPVDEIGGDHDQMRDRCGVTEDGELMTKSVVECTGNLGIRG